MQAVVLGCFERVTSALQHGADGFLILRREHKVLAHYIKTPQMYLTVYTKVR